MLPAVSIFHFDSDLDPIGLMPIAEVVCRWHDPEIFDRKQWHEY